MMDAPTQPHSQLTDLTPSRSHRVAIWLDDVGRRCLDIGVSVIGLILFCPFLVLLGILVKRDSPGPVLYQGLRVGKGGRNFHILKFRTMYEAPKSYLGPRITAADDSRITPVGRWLRDTKLNELPQLWNVLKGEMSIVGPRPEDPQIVAQWAASVQQEILSVRPGITSPASVLYRDEEKLLRTSNIMDDYWRRVLPSKLRLDLLYIRHRSLLVDLDILFWTLVVLLPQARRKTVPEHRLFWGPLSLFFDRYVSWFLTDTLVALVAVVTTGLIWRDSRPLYLGMGAAAGLAVVIALIFSLTNALLGLDRIAWSRARAVDALDLILPSALVTVTLLAIHSLSPTGPLIPNGRLLVTGLLAFLGFVSVRYRTRIITGLATRWIRLRGGAHTTGERVLIIGAGEGGQLATWLLRNVKFAQAFTIVGMVDDDPRKRGMRIDGCRVIGTTETIPSLIMQHDVGLIIFAISNIDPESRSRILSLCKTTPSRIILLPDILDGWRAQFPFEGRAATESRGKNQTTPASAADDNTTGATEHWLDELEVLAQAEDWTGLRAKIQEMRASIR